MTAGEHFALEQLPAVSTTALLTLWTRGLDARSPDPILPDPQAIAVCAQLRPQIAALRTPFYQQLAHDEIPQMLVKLLSVRSLHMDQSARDFLLRFPRSVVVNLGAGLDSRLSRLNEGSEAANVRVIDIDLPAMIGLKRQLFAPHTRYTLLPASVLDFAWMDALDRYDDRRFLFIAEGLFMYLPQEKVRELVVRLASRFPGSELVADVFSAVWLRPPWRKWSIRKLQRQFKFERDVILESGLDSPQEMERWDARLHYLGMWSLFDSPERQMGALRWLRFIPLIRMFQYIVHYRLG